MCLWNTTEETIIDPEVDMDGPIPQPSPAAISISYTLLIFTVAQMKKDSKKHGDPKTTVMQLVMDRGNPRVQQAILLPLLLKTPTPHILD